MDFTPIDAQRTQVKLRLNVEPEGLVEQVGDKLGFAARQGEADLKRFKEFIESRRRETGAWRGEIDRRSLA